jgi:hypothetical protein
MAKPKAKPVRVSVFMPPALDKKIESAARILGLSKSALVALAVADYVSPVKKKAT